MRTPPRPGWALILTAVAAGPAWAQAPGLPQPVAAPNPPAATIGSHQIDRFEAIRQLQTSLRSDPNSLADLVILGELAHEVALDLPDGQDDAYYKTSREAFERALQLDPNNNGLKAAVQFAREQEANAPTFDAQRRKGVPTYLDSRRREIAAGGVNPTLLVYETPTPVASTLPAARTPTRVEPGAPTLVPQQAAANQPVYPQPTYRPYYNPQQSQALPYNQYTNGYVPPAGSSPTTLRQLGQQLPGTLINDATRGLTRPVAPR